MDDDVNILREYDTLPILIEDIVVGVVRSFHADKPQTHRQEYVNWQRVLNIYKWQDTITLEVIQNSQGCSIRTAKRYAQVIKACNPFIVNHLTNPKVDKFSYITVSDKQIHFYSKHGVTTENKHV